MHLDHPVQYLTHIHSLLAGVRAHARAAQLYFFVCEVQLNESTKWGPKQRRVRLTRQRRPRSLAVPIRRAQWPETAFALSSPVSPSERTKLTDRPL